MSFKRRDSSNSDENTEKFSSFNEHRWVIRIRETLTQGLGGEDDEGEVSVCIYTVSKSLRATNPSAYTPQEVAIGPYHQWRPELFEMERYKLLAAKKMQKSLPNIEFDDLIAKFKCHEYKIRACYHRYLDLSRETIAWMMFVDASFLLEYLQIFAVTDTAASKLVGVSSRMSQVVDYSGNKSTHNAILRDIIMLENQIPLFILRELLGFFQHEKPDKILSAMLLGFCKSLTPFHFSSDYSLSEDQLLECDHLLELIYHATVPKSENFMVRDEISPQDNPSCFIKLRKWISSCFNSPIFHFFKRIFSSKILKFIVKIPLKIITKIFQIPVLSSLKNTVSNVISTTKDDIKDEDEEDSQTQPEVPLVDELMIPSVTELSNAGVKFCAVRGDLRSIKFDPVSSTLQLPIINLGHNSEVILRNMVAYEVESASGPLVFTRYTEMMNGIIDTDEDAKLLRESGIIFNHLKSDGDVADLWNGMSKSVKLTKVALLDKAIEDINKFYSMKWKVRAEKFLKKYVFASWPFLTFLAANLLLTLTGLQAFCSVYSCKDLLSGNIVAADTNSTMF